MRLIRTGAPWRKHKKRHLQKEFSLQMPFFFRCLSFWSQRSVVRIVSCVVSSAVLVLIVGGILHVVFRTAVGCIIRRVVGRVITAVVLCVILAVAVAVHVVISAWHCKYLLKWFPWQAKQFPPPGWFMIHLLVWRKTVVLYKFLKAVAFLKFLYYKWVWGNAVSLKLHPHPY